MTNYWITSSPSLAGLPNETTTVHIPANHTTSPITYTFTVTTSNDVGIETTTKTVMEEADPPAPVVLTTTHELGPVIEWSPVSGAASYEILRNGIGIASTTATSYRDVTAAPESVYNYQIQAKNGSGTLIETTDSVNLKYNPIITDSFHGSAEGIYRYNNQLVNVYLGSRNVLYEDTWDPTYSGEWYSAKIPNALPAQSPPVATTYEDDSFQVVYVGPTDVLYL
jgi:hypothetical protein